MVPRPLGVTARGSGGQEVVGAAHANLGEGRTGKGGRGGADGDRRPPPRRTEDGRVALMSRRRAGPREGGRPVCSFGTDVPGSPSARCALATALYVCSLN